MKKCPKCNVEVQDNLLFCPNCGTEFISSKKKLTYLERKQQKEAEQLQLMQKAYVSIEQVEKAKEFDCDKLIIEKKGLLEKTKRSAIIRIAIAVILVLASLAWAFVTINSDLNKNIKLVAIFAAFITIFFAASIFISDLHLALVLNRMQQSVFAAKKIKYGKPLQIYYEGYLYEVMVDAKCEECLGNMHIEEVEGNFVVVCNLNREHVYKLDLSKVHSKYFVSDK